MSDNGELVLPRETVLVFAHYLGVDIERELDLISIADDALKHLPEGWDLGIGEAGDAAGVPYFFDNHSHQSFWQHPQEEALRGRIQSEREKKRALSSSSRKPVRVRVEESPDRKDAGKETKVKFVVDDKIEAVEDEKESDDETDQNKVIPVPVLVKESILVRAESVPDSKQQSKQSALSEKAARQQEYQDRQKSELSSTTPTTTGTGTASEAFQNINKSSQQQQSTGSSGKSSMAALEAFAASALALSTEALTNVKQAKNVDILATAAVAESPTANRNIWDPEFSAHDQKRSARQGGFGGSRNNSFDCPVSPKSPVLAGVNKWASGGASPKSPVLAGVAAAAGGKGGGAVFGGTQGTGTATPTTVTSNSPGIGAAGARKTQQQQATTTTPASIKAELERATVGDPSFSTSDSSSSATEIGAVRGNQDHQLPSIQIQAVQVQKQTHTSSTTNATTTATAATTSAATATTSAAPAQVQTQALTTSHAAASAVISVSAPSLATVASTPTPTEGQQREVGVPEHAQVPIATAATIVARSAEAEKQSYSTGEAEKQSSSSRSQSDSNTSNNNNSRTNSNQAENQDNHNNHNSHDNQDNQNNHDQMITPRPEHQSFLVICRDCVSSQSLAKMLLEEVKSLCSANSDGMGQDRSAALNAAANDLDGYMTAEALSAELQQWDYCLTNQGINANGNNSSNNFSSPLKPSAWIRNDKSIVKPLGVVGPVARLHAISIARAFFVERSSSFAALPDVPAISDDLVAKMLNLFLTVSDPNQRSLSLSRDRDEISWRTLVTFCRTSGVWLLIQASITCGLLHRFNGSEKELREVRRLFDLLDSDLSGRISASNVLDLLKIMGEVYTKSELEFILAAADPGKTGYVEFTEFISWWCSAPINISA